jgi:DNA-binding response OmpR family regulator
MSESRTILIAEDDVDIASALSRGLAADGYVPLVAHDAATALERHGEARCDAAIVDMMLGTDRGIDLVRRLREGGMAGPVLILSALSGVEDRTEGLDAGADDYVAKPFEYAELLARLRVQEARWERLARHGGVPGNGPAPLIGRLVYDDDLRSVTNGARTVSLTERESDVLKFLASNANALSARGDIYDALWAMTEGSSENVVDVYIGYLRRKLAPLDDFGIALRTVRGRGFILAEL